ncbi:MAG: MarR family transcriptional regulator [Alistipes sp.]|nr:MarR family transcriptional regulator [Alistipes sp.]
MGDPLKLENQLCFPLYACAKEVIRAYTPLLSPLGLTYTQYIAMMVMWEHKEISIKEMSEKLMLDSGTLTPMLKKMEQSGWLVRRRSSEDERVVVLTLTEAGAELKQRAAEVPLKMAQCVKLDSQEAQTLYYLLNKLLKTL